MDMRGWRSCPSSVSSDPNSRCQGPAARIAVKRRKDVGPDGRPLGVEQEVAAPVLPPAAVLAPADQRKFGDGLGCIEADFCNQIFYSCGIFQGQLYSFSRIIHFF